MRRVINKYLESPVVVVLSKLGVSPGFVTISGLFFAIIAAGLIYFGFLWIGALVMLFGGILDMFDGALARATDRVSRFGGLLDSVVDRISEAVILAGVVGYFLVNSETLGVLLAYCAFAGSFMVSYARARAEGLGVECNVGIMTRPERVAVLGVGLFIGHWYPMVICLVLGLISILTILTTIQRVIVTRKSLS
jgi:CDP-diacylglycerol--glycerol-3-phosphate 3-phosphatidyltransferase